MEEGCGGRKKWSAEDNNVWAICKKWNYADKMVWES